ncbi:REP-associated tyrosine transposase [Tenacibaculum xiamenense]|uniref:REP-associated tyrosine transposase n=1 Tax=Tenacibaculum xiamenense TaxID=1261553 RepID=UPI003893DB6B
MSRNYKFYDKSGLYFVSFATVNWIDVFIRQVYYDVLANSVTYCRKYKGMELYCYCFMPSHIHFIFRSSKGEPSELLRDFKRHTSKNVLEAIKNNIQESRKEWLLWMFARAGKKNASTSVYQFWQHHNKPIELWSEKVIKQKIDYIHNNPVESGFVLHPEDWKYSSARSFQEQDSILPIDISGF